MPSTIYDRNNLLYGLILGILLTIMIGLLGIRIFLFHSTHIHQPRNTSSPKRPHSSCDTGLYLPIPNLILLHRKLVEIDRRFIDMLNEEIPHAGRAELLLNDHELMDPESVAFINFLVSEIVSAYRSDPIFVEWFKLHVIQAAINDNLPQFIDHVTVSDFSLGQADQFPLFRQARLVPFSRGQTQASTDLHSGDLHPNSQSSWRIELDVEFESLNNVATRVSALTQTQPTSETLHFHSDHTNEHLLNQIDPLNELRQRTFSSSTQFTSRSSLNNTLTSHPPLSSSTNPQTSLSTNQSPLQLSGSTKPCNELDVDVVNPFIRVGLDTKFMLNWPRPKFAALPIHLDVQVIAFRATLAIEFHSSSSTVTNASVPAISVSILSGYKLDVRVSSLLGSRTKLKDVPKITDLVTLSIQNYFSAKLVDPNFIIIPLLRVPTEQELACKEKADVGKKVTTQDQATSTTSFEVMNTDERGLGPQFLNTHSLNSNSESISPPFSGKINPMFSLLNARAFNQVGLFPPYLRPSPPISTSSLDSRSTLHNPFTSPSTSSSGAAIRSTRPGSASGQQSYSPIQPFALDRSNVTRGMPSPLLPSRGSQSGLIHSNSGYTRAHDNGFLTRSTRRRIRSINQREDSF